MQIPRLAGHIALALACLLMISAHPSAARADETTGLVEHPLDDALLPPPPPPALAGAGAQRGPSQFLAGHVAVRLLLPESDGSVEPSSEDWTAEQIADVTRQVRAALDWWAARLPLAGLRFDLQVQVVSTGYEPINHRLAEEGLWIGDVLGRLGFSGSYFDRAYLAAYEHRDRLGSDWATTIFVANSAANTSGRFGDGRFAYAYVNGPFMVLTSDAASYGAHNLAPVVAHELGHIFGALDQYAAAGVHCTTRSGYLSAPTSNSQVGGCQTSQPSIMMELLSSFAAGAVDASARAQVGYQDSDGDGLIDPLDTTPRLEIDPVAALQAGQRPAFSGHSSDVGYPSPNQPPVTINTIARVEYRANGGPWQAAPPADGAYDSADEAFAFEAPLYDGTYLLEFRAVSSIGVSSPLSSLVASVSGLGPQPDYAVSGPPALNSRDIVLDLRAPPATLAVQVSTDPLFQGAAWQPYAPRLVSPLGGAGDGLQGYFVRFRDAAGRLSQAYPGQVLIDTRPPEGDGRVVAGSTSHLLLSASDSGSGVREVQLTINGAEGVWQPYAPQVELPAGVQSLRVRFRDMAGNSSAPLDVSLQSAVFVPLLLR